MKHNSPAEHAVQHRIVSDLSKQRRFTLGISVAWTIFALIFAGVFLAVRGTTPEGEEVAALLVFLLVGLVPLAFALRRRRKRPHYGPTVLELFEEPVVPGGLLIGQAVTGLQTAPREGFLVRLSYFEASGDHESRSVSRLWTDEQRVNAMSTQAHGSSVVIPIALDLPHELPPRWNARRNRTYWRLSISADLPEGFFSDDLRIPVKKRDEPSTEAESVQRRREDAASDLYRQMKSYRVRPPERPLSPGIEVRETGRSFELRLTPAYYRTEALIGTVAALAFGGTTAFLIHTGSCAWLLVPVFGFIALKIGKEAVAMWFSVTSITMEGGAVSLRSGIPWRQREERFPTHEIEAIEVVPTVLEYNTMRFNNPFSPGGTYQFVFHLTGEREVRLRAPLDDKEEAIRLSERLAAAAGVPGTNIP